MALPAHQRPAVEDDTDEELSDEQVRELLNEAERSMRAKASSQQPDVPFKLPKIDTPHIADPYLKTTGEVTRHDPSKLISKKDEVLANGVKKIDDPVEAKKRKQEEKKATAGKEWFNMPKTELTPELRRDLQLLKMRGVLDPKRHYKKSDPKSDVPAFSQVGTIIEGPTEFYSGRINNKDRKRTFLEEVLSQEQDSGKFKKKYQDILKSKASGKKGYYKTLKAKRSKGKVIKP